MEDLKKSFKERGCSDVPCKDNDCQSYFEHSHAMLNTYNWLQNIESKDGKHQFDIIEVRFKNSKKDFYRLKNNMHVSEGDIVVVDAASGYDFGIVSLTGVLVQIQLKKKYIPINDEIKYVQRKARTQDIEKWISVVGLEELTKKRTREIVEELQLGMKINDVEYQGDRSKAIFYYTAEERVDFRELIKILAEQFSIRIEMRQIGARQESAKLGGTGACGRELCCATWLTNFKSVSTNAARIQQLSLNPQKLAGQCSKLKCCLNYEIDQYIEALKEFPSQEIILKTKKGSATHIKTDVYKQLISYVFFQEGDTPRIIVLSLENLKNIIQMNSKGVYPQDLEDLIERKEEKSIGFDNVVGQDDLDRFDKKKPTNQRKNRSNQNGNKNGNRNKKFPAKNSSNEKKSDQDVKQTSNENNKNNNNKKKSQQSSPQQNPNQRKQKSQHPNSRQNKNKQNNPQQKPQQQRKPRTPDQTDKKQENNGKK